MKMQDMDLVAVDREVFCKDEDFEIDLHHGPKGVLLATFYRKEDAEAFVSLVRKYKLLQEELAEILSFTEEEKCMLRKQELQSIREVLANSRS